VAAIDRANVPHTSAVRGAVLVAFIQGFRIWGLREGCARPSQGTEQRHSRNQLTHHCLPLETKPLQGRGHSMPHAHARLRSAVPFRRAMIDRAELLALLAARFRRVRGLSDREDAKHKRRYSKDSKRHDALPGCCQNPIKSSDRCGVSRWARRRCAGVPRRDAFSIPRTDDTAAVNAASSRRQSKSFSG
jgi:hypothetical protein